MRDLRTSKKGFNPQDVLPLLFGVIMVAFFLFFSGDIFARSTETLKCNPPDYDLVSTECNTYVALSRPDKLTKEQKKEGDVHCCQKKPGTSQELYNKWVEGVKIDEDGFELREVTFLVDDKFTSLGSTYSANKGEAITIKAQREQDVDGICTLTVYEGEYFARIVKVEPEKIIKESTGVECKEDVTGRQEVTFTPNLDYYVAEYTIAKQAGAKPEVRSQIFISTVPNPNDPSSQPHIKVSEKRGTTSDGKISCYVYPHTVNTETEESLVNNAYFVKGSSTCDITNTQRATGANTPIAFDSTGIICLYFSHSEIKTQNSFTYFSSKENCDQIEFVSKTTFDQLS